MTAKSILILIIFSISFSASFGQTGIFECNYFEFKSETNPTINRTEFDKKILTLDFDAIQNRYFMWRVSDDEHKEQDAFFKWNIKNKLDANYVKEKNYVQTTYVVRMELLGMEVGESMYLYKIDDLNDKSLTIIIHEPQSNTRHYFYHLKKF